MRAITMSEPGGPEVLAWADVPDPVPAPARCWSTWSRPRSTGPTCCSGRASTTRRPGASPYPGLECSGAIAARRRRHRLGGRRRGVRPAVRRRLRRAGRGPGGPAAARPAGVELRRRRRCRRWPARCGPTSSCSPACARRGCWCTAATSGIGTMAIQLGRAAGARVLVTVGSPEKRARGRSSARTWRCTTATRTSSSGSGGHRTAAAPTSSSTTWARPTSRGTSRPSPSSGRLVVIGLQGGAKAELNLGALIAKRAVGARDLAAARPSGDEKAAIVASVREHVWPASRAARSGRWWTASFRGRRRRRTPRPRARGARRQGAADRLRPDLHDGRGRIFTTGTSIERARRWTYP